MRYALLALTVATCGTSRAQLPEPPPPEPAGAVVSAPAIAVASPEPAPDPDGDGFVGADDVCPNEQGIEPDGCPLVDGDGDGILDPDDQCLEACEVYNGVDDEDGCPDEPVRTIAQLEGILGRIPDLRFEFNKYVIHSSSYPSLDHIAEVMALFPKTKFFVDGHRDSKGSKYVSRMKLTQRRADAVVRYLVEKGIARDRLISRGFGEEVPIANNKTAEGRALNRRVEINLDGQMPQMLARCTLRPAEQALAANETGS